MENSLELAWNKLTISEANLLLARARKEGDGETICASLIQLAHLNFRQGRYHQTRNLATEVLRDAAPDSNWRCDALRMLGNCAAETGKPESADAYYHQAIDLARQLGYSYGLFKCLHSLATNIYWPRGQFALCLSAGKEALLQAQSLDLGEELWFPLSDIGWVYWTTGERVLANEVVNQMQAVVRPGTLGAGFTDCLRAGQIEPGEDYLEKLLPLYDRARSIAEVTGDPGLNMEFRIGLCRAYRLMQNFATALLWAEDAVAVSARMNYRQFQAVAWIERGRTLIDLGNYTNAERDLQAAYELSCTLGAKFDQARSSLYLAVILSITLQQQADEQWQKAIRLIHENGYEFLIDQERTLLLPWVARMMSDKRSQLAETGSALFDILALTPPPPLQIKMLGQFSLQVGPNLILRESLRQRRSGELLALMLSSPGYTLSAEQVIEALCSEKDTEMAVDFYHHAVSALRHLLEPELPGRRFPSRYLEIVEERITLIIPPHSEIDVIEFARFIRQKDWEKAIMLYQGEYLPMYRYAEWTIGLRQNLADRFELALLSLAEEKLNSGSPAACLELAQRAILQNAWQEHAVALGMQAALQMDDRATAVKLYQRLEKKLSRDLGVAPQSQLQQLYREALKHTKNY